MSLNLVILIYRENIHVPTELWLRSPLYRHCRCKTQKTDGRQAEIELDESYRAFFIYCTFTTLDLFL